jgi:hypothetical protein
MAPPVALPIILIACIAVAMRQMEYLWVILCLYSDGTTCSFARHSYCLHCSSYTSGDQKNGLSYAFTVMAPPVVLPIILIACIAVAIRQMKY